MNIETMKFIRDEIIKDFISQNDLNIQEKEFPHFVEDKIKVFRIENRILKEIVKSINLQIKQEKQIKVKSK